MQQSIRIFLYNLLFAVSWIGTEAHAVHILLPTPTQEVSVGWVGMSSLPAVFGGAPCTTSARGPLSASVDCRADSPGERRWTIGPPDGSRRRELSIGVGHAFADARPGSVGAAAFIVYNIGEDNYSASAEARASDVITVTGPPGGVARIGVYGFVAADLGLLGSDAKAKASAYFDFLGVSSIEGSRSIFSDRAEGSEPSGLSATGSYLYHYPYEATYDYRIGEREAVRIVDVPLDATGTGDFWLKLTLEASACDCGGDSNWYVGAAGADYGSTVTSYLQPLSSDVLLASEAGWEIRPYGSPLDPMPTVGRLSDDVLLSLGERSSGGGGASAIPEPATLPLLVTGMLLWLLPSNLARIRQRRRLHPQHEARSEWNGSVLA